MAAIALERTKDISNRVEIESTEIQSSSEGSCSRLMMVGKDKFYCKRQSRTHLAHLP